MALAQALGLVGQVAGRADISRQIGQIPRQMNPHGDSLTLVNRLFGIGNRGIAMNQKLDFVQL